MQWSLECCHQLSKDIPVDELLSDLNKLIATERAGHPVLNDLYESARHVKAEEAVRLGVGVANVRKLHAYTPLLTETSDFLCGHYYLVCTILIVICAVEAYGAFRARAP